MERNSLEALTIALETSGQKDLFKRESGQHRGVEGVGSTEGKQPGQMERQTQNLQLIVRIHMLELNTLFKTSLVQFIFQKELLRMHLGKQIFVDSKFWKAVMGQQEHSQLPLVEFENKLIR